MSAEFLQWLAGSLFFAGAVYGGIRADLKAIHNRISLLHEETTRAHERIDDIFTTKD
jgi:hypothetical protein